MKLRDYNFISQSDLRRLGEWAFWEEEKFIDWIRNKMNLGQRVHPFYIKIYEGIMKDNPANQVLVEEADKTEKTEKPIDPIALELENIPIEEMQYYVDNSEYRRNCQELRRHGIKNLADLYSYVSNSSTKQLYIKTANKWHAILVDKADLILSNWKDFSTTKFLPQAVDIDSTPIDNIENGIKELIAILKQREQDPRYRRIIAHDSNVQGNVITILDKYFNENKTHEDISQELNIVSQSVRGPKAKILSAFLSGEKILSNLCISQDLIDMQKSISENCVYDSEDKLLEFLGRSNDTIVYDLLGYDFVDVIGDIRFVVPKDTKGLYTKVSECFLSILRDSVEPLDKESVIEGIKTHKKISKGNYDFDSVFVENLLLCDSIIETVQSSDIEVTLYRIKPQFLLTKEQRLRRIIYDYNNPISFNEAKAIYQKIYKEKCNTNTTSLSGTGFRCVSNRWQYGEKLKPIKGFIEDYIDQNEEFYYKEIKLALENNGYPTDNEGTIRAYITALCSVDTRDRLHFCLKEKTEDYPEYSWRNASREGLTNWILNRIKDEINVRESISLEELCDNIAKLAAGTDYEFCIKSRVKTTITQFSGNDQPFFFDNNIIKRNSSVYEKTNFDIIGLKGGMYPFYVQIRSIIINLIKKTKDGRISLMDAINIINENLEEKQSRSTIIRALKNKHLPSINVRFENIEGTVFIVRTGEEISKEPIYEIKPSKSVEDEPTIQKSTKQNQNRSNITYRLELNWGKLQDALRSELRFYSDWLQYEHVDDYDAAIEGFVKFIREAENKNLSEKLPQNLYEYCLASTDHFDREVYLCNLALFYEALLSEIYYKQHGTRIHSKGLGDMAMNFPWTARNVRFLNASGTLKGFNRIFKDLYQKRNSVAHGASIDLSSSETAKTIADYVALYIMTVAKYAV